MARKSESIDTDNLIREHLAGAPASQLARKHGVTSKVIVRLLGSEYRTKRQLMAMWADDIVARYTAGESCLSIANSVWFSRRAVDAILKERGVPVRGRSEAEALKWSQMSESERRNQVAAAHDAVRGTKRSFEELCSRAKQKEASKAHASPLEDFIRSELSTRGISLSQQTAVGPYNCDFTTGPVAVEVFGGGWHWHGRHLARTEERFRYIMNAGYRILVIVVDQRFPFTPAVADYMAAKIERLSGLPSGVSEYRVVWGAGEATTGGSLEDDHISIEYPFTCARDRRTGRYKRVPG